MNKSDASFTTFIIGTIIAGIAIFGIVFWVVFSVSKVDKVEIQDTGIQIDELSQKELKGIILNIDLKKNLIDVYDLAEKKIVKEMKLINETKFIDSTKELLSPSELELGDTVDIIYTDKSLAISQVKVTTEGWKKENITSYKIDYIDGKITLDKKIYKFTDDVVIHYQGERLTSKDLTDNVELTFKGYDNYVWAIEVEQYLGSIRLIYPEILEGANVEIDSDKFVNIKEVEDNYLKAGTHKLVIKKADIDPIVLNVEVNENEVTPVDLGEVNTKKSLITFNVNVDDYYVDIKKEDGTVNGTYTSNLQDTSNVEMIFYNQLELPYGNYEMTFRKKGYDSITRSITISTANKRLNVTLTSDGTTIKTTINVVPADAEIYINGKYQGTGKTVAQLYKGANTIRVSRVGYNSIEKTINVETPKDYTFNLVASNIYEGEGDESDVVSSDTYNRVE